MFVQFKIYTSELIEIKNSKVNHDVWHIQWKYGEIENNGWLHGVDDD